MLHVLRRKLVGWLRGVASQRQLDLVMGAVVRVSEGSGALLPPPRAAPPRWAYLGAAEEGRANLGRFTVHSRRARPPAAAAWAAEAVPLLAREAEGAVVFDVQVMQLTLMAAHPQALKHEVAEMEEVRGMFGDVAMQARRSRLHLAYSSPTSRLHLAYISPTSRLHLAYISPTPRLHLACISPTSPPHLPRCSSTGASSRTSAGTSRTTSTTPTSR